MTVAPNVERLAFDDIDQAIAALRARGLRLSASRRLVLEALYGAEGPLSAERIAAELKLDPTSVYRNLEALERNGLAHHVHLGHGPGLYVLVGRDEPEYLYCESCGAVRSLAPEELDPVREQIRKLFGYSTRFTHHAIVGKCAACSASGAARRRRGETKQEHSHGDYVHSHRLVPQATLAAQHRH